MKKFIVALSLIVLAFLQTPVHACVGRILSIGTLGSANEQLLSELLAVIINERTGTTVTVKQFNNSDALYDAVKKGEVSIIIESTGMALKILGETGKADTSETYKFVKEEYRKRFELVLLDPLGVTPASGNEKSEHFVPIITTEVLTDYPALPRVINKLADITVDKEYVKLVDSVRQGDKPKGVAKKFLKKKRLI